MKDETLVHCSVEELTNAVHKVAIELSQLTVCSINASPVLRRVWRHDVPSVSPNAPAPS